MVVLVVFEIVGLLYVLFGLIVVGVLVVVLLIVDGFLLIIVNVLLYDVYFYMIDNMVSY